jgi:hypothetical protein
MSENTKPVRKSRLTKYEQIAVREHFALIHSGVDKWIKEESSEAFRQLMTQIDLRQKREA